jgi:hypothetical protein
MHGEKGSRSFTEADLDDTKDLEKQSALTSSSNEETKPWIRSPTITKQLLNRSKEVRHLCPSCS